MDINDFTFAINVYRSRDIEICLKAFRKAYPQSPCSIFSDGCDWDYAPIASAYKCQFILGDRLKDIGGGFWTARFLYRFAHSGRSQWLIKIDPDTEIVRPLSVLPPITGLFGYDYVFAQGLLGKSIHGGFQGFSRDAAETILRSNLLGHPRYQNQDRFWYQSQGERLSFQDGILSDIATILSLPVYHHPEIYCHWTLPPKEPHKWAAYHPRHLKSNSRAN